MRQANKNKKVSGRQKRFFGLHFDFHASLDNEPIGGRPFAKELARLLREVKPDFVQCDCKGHPGVASYPTEVGTPAPVFEGDALRVWSEETAKAGVPLFMHFSGVWDTAALKKHPEWALVNEKGERDPNNTSVFGPYWRELMVPQLAEVREKYGIEGVWIDGDCWAVCQDYTPEVLREFRRSTGIRSVPKKPEDPGFFEFTEFCREGFRQYLRNWVDALHERCPGIQVASNWAFSSFMPEPVSANVDFLSGDYTLCNSVTSARFEGRCLMHQGKPWDLMAWAFGAKSLKECFSSKSVLQLKREAAVVLALGGGFQMYFQQRRDGSLPEHEVPVMAEVAKFCRKRQKFSHEATSVPQIGLLLSREAHYRTNNRIFGAWDGNYQRTTGILRALLDGRHCVDVVSEHHLEGKTIDRFPLLVVPEWVPLGDAFRAHLLGYVRRGGSALLIGAGPAREFAEELAIEMTGDAEVRRRWLAGPSGLAGVESPGLAVKVNRPAKMTGAWHELRDPLSTAHPLVVTRRVGKGTLAAIPVDLGGSYHTAATFQARDFLTSVVQGLFPEPIVEIDGNHPLDVALMRKDGHWFVHLVNTSGAHADMAVVTHDQIPPLHDIAIRLRLDKKPSAIIAQPGGKPLPFRWAKGIASLCLPQLEIHEILQIKP